MAVFPRPVLYAIVGLLLVANTINIAADIAAMGEALTLHGAIGVLSVCGGVFIVAGGPALLRAAHDPAQRARVHAGLRWGAATGLLIAVYTVLDGYSVKKLLIVPILIDYFGNDPRTHSIVIYMASIGDARSFLSAAREVSLTKPVIVIKAGRTAAVTTAACAAVLGSAAVVLQ